MPPAIRVVRSKPNVIFNAFSRLLAAVQLDTRPALSARRPAEVVLDNGQGVSKTLATYEDDGEAIAEATRLSEELEANGFDSFARVHGIDSDFLARRDPGFWKMTWDSLRPRR
jgi:hypothetical protein